MVVSVEAHQSHPEEILTEAQGIFSQESRAISTLHIVFGYDAVVMARKMKLIWCGLHFSALFPLSNGESEVSRSQLTKQNDLS